MGRPSPKTLGDRPPVSPKSPPMDITGLERHVHVISTAPGLTELNLLRRKHCAVEALCTPGHIFSRVYNCTESKTFLTSPF